MTDSVSVFGLGKVGLCLVSCLAKAGHRVIGVDVSPEIVDAVNDRTIRSDEPGVAERIAGVSRDDIVATLDAAVAVRESSLSFVIVPSPSNMLGGFSNRAVLKVCQEIGTALRAKDGAHTVAVVSTVLPGSSDSQIIPLLESTSGRRLGPDLGYCYNPSFIAQGEIVKGFERPDFLLIGQSDPRAGEVALAAHRSMVCNDAPAARMTPVEAEIAKIASNTHETMRVTFANMLLAICAEVPGANVDRITEALTHRMGKRFFKGAVPYGGPCWPRDNQALSAFMDAVGAPSHLPRTVDLSNAEHGRFVLRKILEIAPPGSKVGVIGLSYKPGTRLIERSYSVDLIGWLLNEGRDVLVWDPQAMDEVGKVFAKRIAYCPDAESCLRGSDVVILALPLAELATIDWSAASRATVIDCWRALPEPSRAAVARYVPLGIGPDGNIADWLAQTVGRRFELLTN